MITQQSFMFISFYGKLQQTLMGQAVVEATAHAGSRAFDGISGKKVNTTAFVLRREPEPPGGKPTGASTSA